MTLGSITMASNGRIVIPSEIRSRLGLEEGARLIVRLVDGIIVLEPVDAAVRRAQAMVARHIPQSSGLVDEFIRRRRTEAERE